MADYQDEINKRDNEFPGYQSNDPADDIFSRMDMEEAVDPENPYSKEPTERAADELTDDLVLGELDVPGAELDDQMEAIGNEDEENNYYSFGSDDNSSLEDDSLRI